MAEAFRRAVVTSVALCCLLARDYVPGARPPPVAEMVARELPRVLKTVTRTQFLGGVEVDLDAPIAPNPSDLLRRVTEAITDFPKASAAVMDHGHEDLVFAALRYTGKPPSATDRRIQKITVAVATALGVDITDAFHQHVGNVYDVAHSMLIRI